MSFPIISFLIPKTTSFLQHRPHLVPYLKGCIHPFTSYTSHNYVLTMFYIIIRWEKTAKHSATLCYLPLPGLCTYPKPRDPSELGKLYVLDKIDAVFALYFTLII